MSLDEYRRVGDDTLINSRGDVLRINPLKWAREKSGYSRVVVDGRRRPIHQLVMEAFGPPRPATATCVRHLDGDQDNNSIGNLAYGTTAENEADKLIHGTRPMGEEVHLSKLTDAQVLEIRASPESAQVLAERFNVTTNNVYYIRKGATWKHLL